MRTKKKNAVFGRYPSCDLINNAIRFILDGNNDTAISELYYAIQKADGYIHEDLVSEVNDIVKRESRRKNDGCKNCEYERRLRVGEDHVDGFCKCTGESITVIEHEHRPEWCPLVHDET